MNILVIGTGYVRAERPWVQDLVGAAESRGQAFFLELIKRLARSSPHLIPYAMPFREDADTNHPLSPYAASKKAAEALCYTYHYLYGIDVTVFRYLTVYGPAGRPDMAPFRFVQWIHEDRPVTVFGHGEQSRDFTYIDDIARGTIAGLQPLGYEVINLGSGKPVTLLDVIHLIENQTGNEATLKYKSRHPADVLDTWANIQKAKDLIGWKPEVDFNDGMKRTVHWYQENRDWAKEIKTLS